MENEIHPIESAVAYLIRKVADILWIIPLALIPAIFLTLSGYASFTDVLDILRRILVNVLWFFFFWKALIFANNQMTMYQENTKEKS